MEPAAVLVGAFQVQVGRELQLGPVRAGAARLALRPAHHGLMRRAGIEPHVERILDLDVLLRLRAQQNLRIQGLPGFDAALLHPLGHLFEQIQGVRMQRAGFFVDEKGHGHAPLALARQGPVGAVGDHAVQARLAPVRVEARVVDATQGGRAQGFGGRHAVEARRLVHAGEPLRAGAIDDGRLVAPAVHVTVHVVFAVEQGACFRDFLHDLGIGLPDHHAAEKRQ